MSFRRVLPAALLSVCASVTGCAADDTSVTDESIEESTSALSLAPPKPVIQQVDVASIVDGSVDAHGAVSFVLDRNGKFPLVFRAAGSAVKTTDTGFAVKGDLTLDTRLGSMTLASADISFERDGSTLERLVGSVELPGPGLGALEGFRIDAPVRATIGYDLGKNLKTKLEAPIQDDRKYLAFDYSVGFSGTAGPVSLSMAGSKGGTVVVDPQDPGFYMTGGMLGLDDVGPLSDMALGLSARGLLAFEPKVTWGVEKDLQDFSGHLYAKGTVTLKRIPVSIDGELVVNVDPNGKWRRIGSGTPDGVQLGANGQLNLDFDAKFVTMKLPLAKASLGARITKQSQRAWISGEVGPDVDWMPSVMPLVPQAKARVAAYVDSNIDASHLSAETDLRLKANKIYAIVPEISKLGLKDIPIAQASFTADAKGLRVVGNTSTPVIPVIKPNGKLTVNGFLPANHPEDFSLLMSGEFSLADFKLGAATARIDRSGARADGSFETPISEIAMSGTISGNGAELDGKVSVPLKGMQETVQKVTDGAVCGYDYVRDGATCGYQSVTDYAQCGSHTVKDAAVCGSTYVTDAAQCGVHAITDAAICGENVLKSAWECVKSGFKNCSAPKTCNVANSCNIANSCDVANSCSVPNSCEKARTCDTKVTVPDAAFGTLEGTLHVSATGARATGSIAGSLCNGGRCVSIGSAQVVLGSRPRVCVSGISGASGAICGEL